jgi:hypothetical protein
MHLNEPPGKRESNAQSSRVVRIASSFTPEHIEYSRQPFGGNTAPIVTHSYHCQILIALSRKRDKATTIGVFGCIIQQVGNNLRQPDAIPSEPKRFAW